MTEWLDNHIERDPEYAANDGPQHARVLTILYKPVLIAVSWSSRTLAEDAGKQNYYSTKQWEPQKIGRDSQRLLWSSY